MSDGNITCLGSTIALRLLWRDQNAAAFVLCCLANGLTAHVFLVSSRHHHGSLDVYRPCWVSTILIPRFLASFLVVFFGVVFSQCSADTCNLSPSTLSVRTIRQFDRQQHGSSQDASRLVRGSLMSAHLRRQRSLLQPTSWGLPPKGSIWIAFFMSNCPSFGSQRCANADRRQSRHVCWC